VKRDWDIIRAVLVQLEASTTANTTLSAAAVMGFPEQDVAYNMRLLEQAGYITGIIRDSSTGDGRIGVAVARSLTNPGHELLDTIRNDTVWTRTKEKFKSKGRDMTFDLVIAVGKQVMKHYLGEVIQS